MSTKFTLLAFAALEIAALVLASCGTDSTAPSLLLGNEPVYPEDLKISLAHPFDVSNNDFDLLFSASPTVGALGLCLTRDTPSCVPGGAGYFAATKIHASGARAFFKTKSSALLEEGLVLRVVASDASGQVLDARTITIARNGTAPGKPAASSTPVPPAPTPAAPPTPPSATKPPSPGPSPSPSNPPPSNGGQGNPPTSGPDNLANLESDDLSAGE